MIAPQHIVLHAKGGSDQLFFGESARDNCNEPTIALQRRCRALGYVLAVTRNQRLEDCSWLLFHDAGSLGPMETVDRLRALNQKLFGGSGERPLFEQAVAAGMQNRMALILAEPPSVCRRNADRKFHSEFRYVFTWDRTLVDGKKYIHALLPVAAEFPEVRSFAFEQRKLIVDISGNKFSAHRAELYSTRRKLIRFLEQEVPDDFDLYGTGWRRGGLVRLRDWHHYRCYKGPVRQKSDVLPQYRFAVCYENIAGIRDYVSNRIFDVLRCKIVPIYLGTSNIEDYVDPKAFVDRRNFGSDRDLLRYISSISKMEYQRIVDAGSEYLESEMFAKFRSSNWVDTIVNTLGLTSRDATSASRL